MLCRPVKSATNDNLLPRGASAFFGEIDGNLCARKNDSAVEPHWFEKTRGMDFAPIAFRLDTGVAELPQRRKGQKDGDRRKASRRSPALPRGCYSFGAAVPNGACDVWHAPRGGRSGRLSLVVDHFILLPFGTAR